jgi:hypothetical protein
VVRGGLLALPTLAALLAPTIRRQGSRQARSSCKQVEVGFNIDWSKFFIEQMNLLIQAQSHKGNGNHSA